MQGEQQEGRRPKQTGGQCKCKMELDAGCLKFEDLELVQEEEEQKAQAEVVSASARCGNLRLFPAPGSKPTTSFQAPSSHLPHHCTPGLGPSHHHHCLLAASKSALVLKQTF